MPADRSHSERPALLSFLGVYDADGTWRGELSYWIGARLGRTHCSLCEITHGTFTEKPQWRALRATLPVPFSTAHRDDQPSEIRTLLGRALPAVVAQTSAGPMLLLGPEELAELEGEPAQLLSALRAAAEARHLKWPAP